MSRARETMLAEYERVKPMAEKLARLKSQAESTYTYPDEGPALTHDGMIFFDLVDIPYDTGQTIGQIFIPWSDIDNYKETVKGYENKIADRKREEKAKGDERERKQYERLKEKYG